MLDLPFYVHIGPILPGITVSKPYHCMVRTTFWYSTVRCAVTLPSVPTQADYLLMCPGD